jgi:MFS family permease
VVGRLLANSGWRFLMISGALPALLVFFIRLFVPESKKWEHEKARGATSHWSNVDLIGVSIGCLASIAIIWSWSPAGTGPGLAGVITVFGVAVALWGFLFPVRRYLARAVSAKSLAPGEQRTVIRHMLLGAGLAGVALLGTWGSIQWAPRWAFQLEPDPSRFSREYTQICSALGAIVFPILTGVVAGKFGRRVTYAALCVGSILSCLLLYQGNDRFDGFFLFSIFLAGGITAGFYGWFPLYLPELFPTVVRATGQGFAYNFGRILAAVGGLQTASLMSFFGGSFPMAGSVLTAIYAVGLIVIWLGPETLGKPLPE